MMHHDTITKSHSILMNYINFIKTRLPVKIATITALSNISIASFNTFLQSRSTFSSHTLLVLTKELHNGITEGKKATGTKLLKLLIAAGTVSNSYR